VTLPLEYLAWNRQWGAPYGYSTQGYVPYRLRLHPWASRFVGMFAFQSNNSSRRWEYAWAWDRGNIRPGLRCLDLGAGHSGFPFALARAGAESWVVDPFLDYGGSDHYGADPAAMVQKMNRAFHTDVKVVHGTIDDVGLPPGSVDRIFCLSALEHMPPDATQAIAQAAQRLLRPQGRFIATIDLFLNISPFTTRHRNRFGTNMDVRAFVEATGLRLIEGTPAELVGYAEFDADSIQSRLETFSVTVPYPVLTQCLVVEASA